MNLYTFTLDDYEEVVNMCYEFNKEVYPNRVIGKRYFYYKEVISWIDERRYIVIARKGNDIVGFSMSKVSHHSGLLEPTYETVIVYIKPEYRKTRAAYLLYHNVSECANDMKLMHTSTGAITTGGADIIEKHFGCKQVFTGFERKYDEQRD